MITGRVEEWRKAFCREHHCEYYFHREYPLCGYCTYPGNCQFIDKRNENTESKSVVCGETEVDNADSN